MSEARSRSRLVKALKPLDAVPVENRLRSGHPDVNCTIADIECKYMKTWPKSADVRPVRFPHPLSKEQAVWLKRRWDRGGITLVCAQVSLDWFFFLGSTAGEVFGKLTRPQMEGHAGLHMKRLDAERLIAWLKKLRSERDY